VAAEKLRAHKIQLAHSDFISLPPPRAHSKNGDRKEGRELQYAPFAIEGSRRRDSAVRVEFHDCTQKVTHLIQLRVVDALRKGHNTQHFQLSINAAVTTQVAA